MSLLLPIFYQQTDESFPLCLQVSVINADEVIAVDDYGRNGSLQRIKSENEG